MVSINRTTPPAALTNATSATFTVTFSEAVMGVDSTAFSLAETGPVSATLTQVTPLSSSVYTVSIGGILGNGTLGLNLMDNGRIHDLAGNPLVQNNAAASFAACSQLLHRRGALFRGGGRRQRRQ